MMPLKPWTPSDIRRLIDAALDGFAEEFFGMSYKHLDRADKVKLTRALKSDAKTRAAYEWMMRTA